MSAAESDPLANSGDSDRADEALYLFHKVFGSPFSRFFGNWEKAERRRQQDGKALRDRLCAAGVTPTLTPESYARVAACGFNHATLVPALVVAQVVTEQRPLTVRGVFYRVVSAGIYPDTSNSCYRQCQQIVLKLRRHGVLPYEWIVDSTRRRLKPSSWSGLADYADTVAQAYRRDLWTRQRDYVEIFCEKDAMAGVIEPVTNEYDVYLNVIRGQVSETFAYNIAEDWKRIEKPIYAYYLGDHDPSGLEIEEVLRTKLETFSERKISWARLAVTHDQFRRRDLLGFRVKDTVSGERRRRYIHSFGNRCVEVDALEPNEIRTLVRSAIEGHIDQDEWRKLQETERLEKQTVRELVLAPKLQSDGAAPQ
jgi:hypothetical protein